jgi:hypothetical protein
MVVCPHVSVAQQRHPAWSGHLATLRSAGVGVLELRHGLQWTSGLDAIDELPGTAN